MLDMKTLRRFYIAVPLALLALNVQATEAVGSNEQGSSWLYMEQSGGLVTNVPAMERQELIGSVKEYRQTLADRKAQLSNTVKKKKFSTKDALITAVVPGGMLYASYKMASYKSTKKELETVSLSIDELTSDVVRLTALEGENQLAMLY
jgi:hypothetical protein